ncbi:hypothetical protein [Aquamicrobium defluvii]|nr:hypothetical protein [Aquamicrobium defluvii]EZQ14516.1 hypothetical protein CF98_20030 [Halopseudomonas bauzanensis]
MTYLANTYIELKYGNATREDWKALMVAAGKELQEIKAAKSDVFKRYPNVHGRFQQSQLDVLDIREQKICAIYDNAMLAMTTARQCAA